MPKLWAPDSPVSAFFPLLMWKMRQHGQNQFASHSAAAMSRNLPASFYAEFPAVRAEIRGSRIRTRP